MIARKRLHFGVNSGGQILNTHAATYNHPHRQESYVARSFDRVGKSDRAAGAALASFSSSNAYGRSCDQGGAQEQVCAGAGERACIE